MAAQVRRGACAVGLPQRGVAQQRLDAVGQRRRVVARHDHAAVAHGVGQPAAARDQRHAAAGQALQHDDAEGLLADRRQHEDAVPVERRDEFGRDLPAGETDPVGQAGGIGLAAQRRRLRAVADDGQAGAHAAFGQQAQRGEQPVDALLVGQTPDEHQVVLPRRAIVAREHVVGIRVGDDGRRHRQRLRDGAADRDVARPAEHGPLQARRQPVARDPGVVGDDPGPSQQQLRPGEAQADVVVEHDVGIAHEGEQPCRGRLPHDLEQVTLRTCGRAARHQHHAVPGTLEMIGEQRRDRLGPADGRVERDRAKQDVQGGSRAVCAWSAMAGNAQREPGAPELGS